MRTFAHWHMATWLQRQWAIWWCRRRDRPRRVEWGGAYERSAGFREVAGRGRRRMAGEVTELLSLIAGGDEAAADRLIPVVYQDLHALAAAYLRRERAGHTLQPTALVN